jgi:hypothetical protein
MRLRGMPPRIRSQGRNVEVCQFVHLRRAHRALTLTSQRVRWATIDWEEGGPEPNRTEKAGPRATDVDPSGADPPHLAAECAGEHRKGGLNVMKKGFARVAALAAALAALILAGGAGSGWR